MDGGVCVLVSILQGRLLMGASGVGWGGCWFVGGQLYTIELFLLFVPSPTLCVKGR